MIYLNVMKIAGQLKQVHGCNQCPLQKWGFKTGSVVDPGIFPGNFG